MLRLRLRLLLLQRSVGIAYSVAKNTMAGDSAKNVAKYTCEYVRSSSYRFKIKFASRRYRETLNYGFR